MCWGRGGGWRDKNAKVVFWVALTRFALLRGTLHKEDQSMNHQLTLPLIPHAIEGEIVTQRQVDGYINATAMCRAAGKLFADYGRLKTTEAFLDELSADMGIPISVIIQSIRGGEPTFQGTWVHPQVAVNLAQWLSPKFAVQVSKWVYDWFSQGKKPAADLPYHLRRYVMNMKNVPAGHFSVLTEITLALIAPMEMAGYKLPEKLWPDISEGIMFANYMRDELAVRTDLMPTYQHEFEDGRKPAPARAYPNQFVHMFRDHFVETWLPKRALAYFKERDPTAIPYLKTVLAISDETLPPKRVKGPVDKKN